jgi:hypothetical protein
MAATVAPFRGRGEMLRPKVAMRRIKEVLRLKEGLGLSDTAVSRSVRIARSIRWILENFIHFREKHGNAFYLRSLGA